MRGSGALRRSSRASSADERSRNATCTQSRHHQLKKHHHLHGNHKNVNRRHHKKDFDDNMIYYENTSGPEARLYLGHNSTVKPKRGKSKRYPIFYR